MTRTRIKICGVRDVATAHAAAAAGADAVGLVLVAGSPRCINVDQAKEIAAALPAIVEPVGLFVAEPPSRVLAAAKHIGLRTVQLHGDEGPEHVQQLKDLRVIKAIGFAPASALQAIDPWRSRCPNLVALLWDAPAADAAACPGGSGQRFNWDEVARLESNGALDGLPPRILAGGLTPRNVGRAIATVHPYAVDVSSGVESAPGLKDVGLIAAFCHAVRRADQALESVNRPLKDEP